ncbi:DUF5994 family protein [Nonomuraea africana]|uniref:Uncharacterized protein n=1 Tax=Nonomuraea africana TaxID=46171 RepID=A0ABR9KDE1_9ACTN|nr:DUF5994 family protein [Nonomuraea africana]MBE1559826.1 hypothetical protein [Nonomuraea africana]
MTPRLLSKPPQPRAVAAAPRLSLNPASNRQGSVDGAWWPRTRDAAAELPGLIAAVDERLGRSTLRVGVHRDAWENLPHRIPAPGRQVKVGWFLSTDPLVITLVLVGVEPLTLLIIPPDTGDGAAEAALALAAQDPAGRSPAEFLTLAHLPAGPEPLVDRQDGAGGWENEGGHLAARS